MICSIYDLVHEYINIVYPNDRPKGERKKTIHREIKNMLKSGWVADELIEGFKAWARRHPDKPTLYPSKIFVNRSKKKKNIIPVGRFFYHNLLRIAPPPPKRHIDYDLGEITTVGDMEYYLEMRASMTVNDLADYYFKQFGMKPASSIKKRVTGSLGYLLKNYDVEMLLFMIDVSANECHSEDLSPPRTPLDLEDHDEAARMIRDTKRTEAVISGGNKIVRRKRVQRS
ncbi:hypothetical protein ACK8P5_26660 (plasmid) [Paenibacillus sp. EC2-1]|uniref:hypothetical protein n=1 Tax=Paenibacillus sp. EC2-1 TaxID=3388665 RepID=UPI003BEEDA7F